MGSGWGGALGTAIVVTLTLAAAGRAEPGPDPAPLAIHISKSSHAMRLQQGETLVREFPVALGKGSGARKQVRGDARTPLGTYYVCAKRPSSRFHRFLGISYPNIEDAERAFSEKLIDADEWADIFFANLRLETPPWRTALGGQVGIHGVGGRAFVPVDWTEGCIAVSDADIDYLYDRVPLGTPVVINE